MRAWRTVGAMLLGPLSLALVCGCGGPGGPPRGKTAKVSGKITWQGKPVAHGSITLVPSRAKGNKGRAATGAVKNGAFALTTYEESDGALVGWHRVELSYPKGDPEKQKMEAVDLGDHLPDIYRGDKSVLAFEVKEGADNKLDLDLPRPEDKDAIGEGGEE